MVVVAPCIALTPSPAPLHHHHPQNNKTRNDSVCPPLDRELTHSLNHSLARSAPCALQCSSTCAGGFQRRVVVCQDADGRSNSYCDERVKPAESKSCDSGPCPLWNYSVWGEVRHQQTDHVFYMLLNMFATEMHLSVQVLQQVCLCSCSGFDKSRRVSFANIQSDTFTLQHLHLEEVANLWPCPCKST